MEQTLTQPRSKACAGRGVEAICPAADFLPDISEGQGVAEPEALEQSLDGWRGVRPTPELIRW